jgi:archaeal flagellar protein FlaJ
LKVFSFLPKKLSSKFGSWQLNTAKASIRLSFEMYVGMMTFFSIIASATMFTISFVVLSSASSLFQALTFAFLIGLLTALISIGSFYLYPLLEINSRARRIDANLPLIANFMSVLASSGMPPERIFRSLANVGDEFGVGKEIRRLIADIELLGLDLNQALKKASLRSPSTKFARLFDGVVTTSHMGGDLSGYLRDEADKFKKARIRLLKSFLENLGQIAEGYVSFLIAFPLTLVIMLSVMSALGGGALIAGIDPAVLLTILTFLITPAGVAFMLLLVDSVTPPR